MNVLAPSNALNDASSAGSDTSKTCDTPTSAVPIGGELRKNKQGLAWVVQKFGGTSVGKFALNICEDIVRYGPLAANLSLSLLSMC